MKKQTLLVITLLSLFISACKETSNNIEPGGEVLTSFSSTIHGDYPLLDNASIDELISDNPYIAAFPEIIKAENPRELERFIAESETHGFDKQQFDTLYQAAIEVVKAIHIGLINQVQMIDQTPLSISDIDTSGIALESIIITGTKDPGERRKNATYTFTIDQNIDLPNCNQGPQTCNIQLELLAIFHFPIQNISIDLGPRTLGLTLLGMQISTPLFRVSNSLASLDLALNPESSFVVDAGHSWVLNDDKSPKTLETWTYEEPAFVSSIKGVFTNQYINESGQKKEITITGSAIGMIEDMSFDFNFNDRSTLSPAIGKTSGNMKGANVDVNFVTEISNH